MTRVYLSGPMTGIQDFNFPAFYAEAARLRGLGYEVVNPAEINDASVPYNQCLREDLKALLDCDAIAMMDGWMDSSGAHLEMHVAHRVGIRVVLSRDIVSLPGESPPPRPWSTPTGGKLMLIEFKGAGGCKRALNAGQCKFSFGS